MSSESIIIDILIPIVTALIGAAAIWFVQKNLQEKREVERQLSAKRQEIYMGLLDPYIRIFSDIKGPGIDQAIKKITSHEYKKIAFGLALLGSDEVIKSYNTFMRYTFESEASGERDTGKLMRLWGNLLLEIRKSLGNKKTTLKEKDMLQGMIKDINNYL